MVAGQVIDISGNPVAAGNIGSFAVNISSCPTITLSPASLPNSVFGFNYNQTVTASPIGGNYTFTVTSGSLPGGLNLNATTGVISGTLTSMGASIFSITATDSGGCSSSRTYTITVLGILDA